MGRPLTRKTVLSGLRSPECCPKMLNMTQPRKTTLPAVNWLTVAEVADYFDVARMTVYRWIRSGELPAVQLGNDGRNYRIDEEAVKALMKPVDRS
jgi:excisionase family DNA binding protein